jgi:asparagine synthase (glutamine-hydrolysing)
VLALETIYRVAYLVDDITARLNRASTANSLQGRCPLDQKLMELVVKIPSGLKLFHNQGKYVFKKALEGVVPRDVLTRSKKGFALPVAEWFPRELKASEREVLIDQRDDVLDRATAAMCWNQHRGGRRSRSALLWFPSMFQTLRELSKAA